MTAPVFLRPASKHGACSPGGSPRTLRARLSDTKNRKPSRISERPQRRADAVRRHRDRDRQDQSRKRAAHTRHDNDLMSAPATGTALFAGNQDRPPCMARDPRNR